MSSTEIHCACVVHGEAYDIQDVSNLYAMLQRHLDPAVTLHVLTEPDRALPKPWVHHALRPWPRAHGARGAWWNKLQLFDPDRFSGLVLYFDLDVVIVQDITWMLSLDPRKFWAIRDFRRLWRPHWSGINSSVMVWNADHMRDLGHTVAQADIDRLMQTYHGDQDYLTAVIPAAQIGFFPDSRCVSWRWQVMDGGMDMDTRRYRRPGAGAVVPADADVVVFHGRPKPHQIDLPWIHQNWRAQDQLS